MRIDNKTRPLDIVIRVLLWGYAAIVLLPLAWVFITSLKTNQEFTRTPWALFADPNFINYVNAWNKANFSVYALNSVVITVIAVLITTLLACYAAYVLVRMKFFGSDALLMFFIAGLYIPLILVLPSQFVVLNSVNMVDNRFALILVYVAFSLPFSILVMSGFMKSIPVEMEEAAYIDGCSYNRTFWKVIMPMSWNGILTMTIFNFLWIWNDFIVTLTLIISDEKRTLPVGIISLMATFKLRADWVTLFAALNMVMIPTIIIYLIFQKSLQQGLTLGAVKE